MEKKHIISELKAAKVAIDAALAYVQATPDPKPAPAAAVVGSCLWCKKEIREGEPTTRGVHEHCYNELYHYVRIGEQTLEEFEKKGLLGPRRAPGRKRKPLAATIKEKSNAQHAEDVEHLNKTLAEIEQEKPAKKPTRKKKTG
jgi:hypothetical protein